MAYRGGEDRRKEEGVGRLRQEKIDSFLVKPPTPPNLAEAEELAKRFNVILEESREKGYPPCPSCFEVDAVEVGYRRVAGVKVHSLQCRGCGRKFREDWLPVRIHGVAGEASLALTMLTSGAGSNWVSSALKFLKGEFRWIKPMSKQAVSRFILEAGSLIRAMEDKILNSVECGKIVAFTVKRKLAGRGAYSIALAIDSGSRFWVEATPAAEGDFNAFLKSVRLKVKPRIAAAPEPLAGALRRALGVEVAVLSQNLMEEWGTISVVARQAKRVVKSGFFTLEAVDAALTVARAYHNFFSSREAPPIKRIGVPFPKVRGWSDLLRYAEFVRKKSGQLRAPPKKPAE